jgi:chorismate mutase
MTTATANPTETTGPGTPTNTTSTGVPPSPENASAEEHIAKLRRRLDEIDQKLIELWRERAAISQEVGQTRLAAGGTRLVLAREQEILHRFREALGSDGTQLALLLLRAGRGKLASAPAASGR